MKERTRVEIITLNSLLLWIELNKPETAGEVKEAIEHIIKSISQE